MSGVQMHAIPSLFVTAPRAWVSPAPLRDYSAGRGCASLNLRRPPMLHCNQENGWQPMATALGVMT